MAETLESERGDRLRALVDAVDTLFKIVVIDLDKNDDAQVIFEVLNGRQTELSASDLVKNLIFLRAEFAKAEHLEELYDQYWAGFDDQWWKKKVGTGHAQRYRRDVLLSVWLTATTASDVSVGNLYGEVRGYLDREKPKTEELLAELKQFATAYEEIYAVRPVADEVIRRAYDRLIELNNLTAIPVLAWMRTLPESVLRADEHRAAVLAIESFTVRRMIAGWTTRGYGATFVKVMKDARAAEPGAIREAIVEALVSAGWPNDPELNSAMAISNFYAMAQFRQRLVLGGIDQQMRADDPKQAPATVDYARLQIEHVLPQVWAPHWPVAAGLDEMAALQAKEARDLAKNRIGNLTLVTQHFNGSVSNLGWDSKQPEFAKQSSIMLNVAVAVVPDWDEEAIEARASMLASVAAKVWPSAQELGWLMSVDPVNASDSQGAPEVLGEMSNDTLAVKFRPEDLPKVGDLQYRQGGDYKPALRDLTAFAFGDPTTTAHVKALVHLGWVRPGGPNNSSGSTAFEAANTANLPAACWAVGSPAAPQISANMRALHALGAPESALDDLWAAYVGKGTHSTP